VDFFVQMETAEDIDLRKSKSIRECFLLLFVFTVKLLTEAPSFCWNKLLLTAACIRDLASIRSFTVVLR